MRTAVIGGGALGLTVALRLAQAGDQVVVYEREQEAGGLAAGFRPAPELPGGGPYLEKFYHHLFRSDRAVTALIQEMGLGSKLVWPEPINALLYGGKIWQPYTAQGLLRFTPLSLVDRARMAIVLAYLKAEWNAGHVSGVTAHTWLQRWMGRRAYQVFWEPLLRAKFGSHYDQVAMPWFWARIHYRSFALGYLKGGFQQLYDALVAEIRRLDGEVRLGWQVDELRREAVDPAHDAWHVTARHGQSAAAGEQRYGRVVSTLPTRLTLRLAPQLPEDFRARYEWGEALGAHCLILAIDRPLLPHGEYWLNVNDPGYPFLVLVEHTNYMPAEEYGGRHLIYLGNYLPMDHPLFRKTKEEALAELLPAVQRVVPAFSPAWVRESWSFAAPYAQPVVTLGYPDHIPPLKSPLPDLWIGSMFQVYPQDRGQNYSVLLGEKLASAIRDECRRQVPFP